MPVYPSAPRYRLEHTSAGLTAVVPSRRAWFIVLFLSAWFVGWIFGEVNAIRKLISATAKTPTAFLAFWLLGWTVGGIFAAGTLLWQFGGQEVITVTPTELSHRVEAFGFGRTRSYALSEVKQFRATDYGANPLTNQAAWFPSITGSGFGPIAFDYGSSTIRLGAALEEAEGKLLVRELSTHLPRTLNEP
jgi:hypothetical protein